MKKTKEDKRKSALDVTAGPNRVINMQKAKNEQA